MMEGCPLNSVRQREQKGNLTETTMKSLERGPEGPERADLREEEGHKDFDPQDHSPRDDEPLTQTTLTTHSPTDPPPNTAAGLV